MKKIFYSLGTLVILFLIGLGIKESFFVNDTPKKDSDSNMSISVSDDSEFVNAITEAKADYETVTEIVLTSDVTLTSEINIKNGQNIRIVNQVNGVEIGQTDLGHILTVNSTISVDRQASLYLETNTILGSSGTIMASDDNNATNLDFNAELVILDSLTINENASLNTSMFKELDLSGSINLVGGEITGDGTLNVNKEAGIIQTSGTYEDTVKFTGDGLFVTTKGTAPEDLQHKVTDAQTFSNSTLDVSSGTYILTNTEYDLGSLTLADDLNLFSICDTKINVGYNHNITVDNGYSLNIGGINEGNSFYSAGTNQIVIDGGATWTANNDGNYYFVTGAYEAGMDLNGSSVENYGRSRYSASGSTSTTPTIKVKGSGTTLNLYRGVTLQNRINTQTAETGENVGGAISLYSSSRVNLNINGASIRYNALTNIRNSAGGAGIGAQNGDINFIYGDVSYNTLYNLSASNSSDGAGISLVNNSNLTMEEGSKVSYNHGNGVLDSDGGADAGGIMVREGSDLTINGGEVSYNFTYGFGGGICIYNSDVTIKNGLVYGNRSTYGGGISTSGSATVILGEEGKSSNLEVAYNTAFSRSGNNSSGFGGGLALGNSTYITNQSLIVYDGLIHNNTAVYGGGISNYSTGNSNNNKLSLNGGTISDNKASSSNQGDGIYAINTTNSGTEPLIVMSGNIQVSTSNNIVFAGLTNETTIAVDNSNWQYWENDNTYKYNWGTLVINNVNCENGSTDYIVLEPAGTNDNDSTYNFQITPTVDITFSALMAKKNGWGEDATLRITNTIQGTHEDIPISSYRFGSERQSINLEANNTYTFTSNTTNHVCMREIMINNGQTPIRVSDQLTATGIVGLISYADSNQYITNSVLANYTTGNAQADKFIIDNTNYRIETSGTQVLIVQNTDNIIAYVNNKPFSNLTDAINYIMGESYTDAVSSTSDIDATIKIINNVNLQGADFITIPTGYNIKITSSGGVPYTLNIPSNITNVTNTTLFTVSSGATFTLDNIIIEGNSTQSAGYLIVENNGTFTLNNNATINNNLGIDGYASAIEIGRGKTTTNIYGSITNNIGDYGAIYLSNSEAVVNICNSAIITGNTYTGSTNGLENITDADIFIENGTLNLTNFSGQIGTIIKQGSGSIKANNISNTTPINIKLNGNNYVRNNVVVEVEVNNDYSSKFNLLEPQDDKEYDSLIKENDGYNIILNMVLTIEISFEDIWQSNGNSYTKISNTNNVHISDANFDTLGELESLKNTLGLSYDIDYHVGESALFFYIDSTSQLVFTNLANVAARSGYYLNGFVRHGLDETTSNTFYGMDSFISVQNFTDTTSHIYLGVEWLPEQYTLEFNNGGLSTANQTMTNQTIPYSIFETGSPTINHNLYFATGFYFKGWKVRIDSNSYVQDENGVLILANNAEITAEILNTIFSQTNSNTFVLEAVWGSIFGDVKSDGDVNLAHVGTSSDAAFEISTKAGLEALADTVNGNNETYKTADRYEYYTSIGSDGTGSFEAFSYENYYFKITDNIDDVSKVIGNIVDLGDDYFTSEDAQKPIQDPSVLAGSKPFSGTLDGESNTINININDSNNKDFVGLFAYTKDATITNIKIAGSVSGRISVGSLVGLAYGGTYRNIESDADVAFNGINAGGIFGTYYIEQSRYTEGSITNVVNRGNVTYSPINNDPSKTALADGATWAENQILYAYQGSRAGGIVGQSWHLTLREAYNSGNISARFGVGGIVGTMISENDSTRDDSVVNTAFNSGKIEATSGLLANYTYNNDGNVIKQVNAYVGGIAGRMYGASTLTNAMNIGEVSATWTGTLNNGNYEYNKENPTLGARGVGGILGVTSIDVSGPSLAGGNKTVSNVINTGKVSAWTHVGGIAGILAYSDLSYALNSGIVKATGETGDSKGGFTYNGKHYNFMGALVGLGVSASIASTAVFDGDIEYSGYTDSIIQAIGDDIANENNDASFIGYPLNSSSALKLASSHLVCQPNDQKPLGLDSTFFDSGWVWKSYSDEGNSYRYYPQLVSFSSSNIILKDNKPVTELSKEAVRLTNIDDKPIDDTYTVILTLDLQGGVFADSGISIDDIIFTLKGNTLESNKINYLTHQTINLATIEALMSYESYYFAGWYRDSSFSEEFDGTISSTDETIYAKWEPRAYNINLIGLQQYANAGVELADDTLLTYTIEDTMGSGKTFILPTIKENKAYSFSHYEITLNGSTFNATSFNIVRQENGQYLLTFYYGSAQEQTSIRTLSQLDFTLICNPINYNIEYSYYDNINNEEITVQNPNQPTFNINSTFGLVNPNILGYDFVGWYLDDTLLTDYTIANVIEKLIENGVEGLRDIKLVAKYKPQELTLSLNLNGGNFKGATSGQVTLNLNSGNYKFTRNEQGLWVTTIAYGESLDFIDAIDASHIIAPAGRTFEGISYSLDGETVEIPETMPAGGIQLFVIYTKTTYDIEVVIGDANNITYDINDIANAFDDTNLIKVVDNELHITISYGEDATEVLDAIRGMVNSNNYHFGGYDAKNGEDTFNYTNVRLPENNDHDPTITFLWQLDSYTVAIFDSLGNFISQFDTNGESGSWINGNTIDIESLKNNINGLWNGHSVTGYDNSQNFLILIDNKTVYDSTSSTETTIDITGYTIIRLVLTPKEYDITFKTNGGSEIIGDYSLSYNQQIDLDSLPKTTKPCYDFVGWTYNDNLLIDNDIFIPTTSDLDGNSITLTAQYREATYNISFNITANRYWNGALTKESTTFTYGGEEITLDSKFFDFKGYNFIEEATYNGVSCSAINNSFVEGLVVEGLADIRDISINVTLEIKQISITFYAGEEGYYGFNKADLARGNDAYYLETLNGDHITNNTGETLKYYVVEVDYYSTANRYLPSNPQRSGYTYSNYSSNNGVLIQDTLENNQTFNANYSADTYTVIYINDNVSTSIEAEYNEVITLPTYTKEGYTFTGFVVQGTNGPLITGTYTVTGDVVLVAQYEGDYDLEISVSNEGLKTSILNILKDILTDDSMTWPDNNIFSIPYGTDLSRLNNITSSEQIVSYTKGDLPYQFSSMPAEKITVSATLETKKYITVTFKVNDNENEVYKTSYYAYEDEDGKYYLLDTNISINIKGYTFDNIWYHNNDVYNLNNGFTAATTLYGTASKIEYELTYEYYDNGILTTKTITVYYGDTIKDVLIDVVNNRPGYAFLYWTYLNGVRIDESDVIENNVVVVPYFENVNYQVKFTYSGVDLSAFDQLLGYGQAVTYPTINDLNLGNTSNYYNLNYSNGYNLLHNNNDLMTNLDVYFNEGNNDYSITFANNTYTITIELTAEPKEFTLHFIGSNLNQQIDFTVSFKYGDDSINIGLSSYDNVPHYKISYIGVNDDLKVAIKDSYTFADLISLFVDPTLSNTTQEVRLIYEAINYKFIYGEREVVFTINDSIIDISSLVDLAIANAQIGHEFKGFTINGLDNQFNSFIRFSDIESILLSSGSQEITLTHKYDPISISVIYNDLVGNIYQITVPYGTSYAGAVSVLEQQEGYKEPQRAGYDFEGWYNSNEGGQTITSTKTFKAIYEKKPYNINYELDGGNNNSSNPTTYTVEDNVIFANPTKEGYTFVGWYLEENYQTSIKSTNGKYENLTLYAKWEANTYTVTFNNNGSTSTQTFTYDQEQALTKNDTDILGYNFKGWATTPGGDVVYQDEQIVLNLTAIPNGNINLYAIYEIVKYTIIYQYDDSNDESIVVTINDFVEENGNYNYSLKDYYKLGYTFNGWNILNDKESYKELTFDDLSKLANNNQLTLTPKMDIIDYTLSFASNGGTSVEDITIKIDTNIDDILANTTERTGYTFNGWYNGNGEKVDEISDIIKANDSTTITIYADWEAIEYTIKFEVNASYGNLDGENSKTLKYDEAYTLPIVTANSNYNFLYWTDGTNNYQAGTKVLNLTSEHGTEITITAVFEFTITFDSNGGTGTVSSISGIIDSDDNISVILPGNGFTREHYRFVGWSTTNDGGTIYQPGEVYTSLAQPLYAIWEAEEYTIKYYDDSNNLLGSDTYTYGEGYDVKELPVINGYNVTGWYEEDNKIFNYTLTTSGNINLHYSKDANEYTTTITIKGLKSETAVEAIKTEIKKKISDSSVSVDTSNLDIIITLTTEYNESREILNKIFADKYEYVEDGVTYTLYPQRINPNTPYENDNMEYSFITTSIVVNLYAVYGEYGIGLDPETNMETLGNYVITNQDLTLNKKDIDSYIRAVYGYTWSEKWYYENENGKYVQYTFTDSLTTSLNLYADYKADEFTINYDGNSQPQNTHYNSNDTVLSNSECEGYKFIGYAISENGLVVLQPGDDINKVYDLIVSQELGTSITLYPIYESNVLTISFENGNQNAVGNMPNVTYLYSELLVDGSLQLPEISSSYTLIGHRFSSWKYYLGDDSYDNLETLLSALTEALKNGDVTLTLEAVWEVEEYSITYIDAVVSGNNSYHYGDTMELPTPAIKEGYEFNGWYIDTNYSQKVDSIISSDYGNKIYYAKWEAKTYKIYFELTENESFVDSSNLKYDAEKQLYYVEQAYGHTINYLPNVIKDNYNFNGWQYNNEVISVGNLYNYAQDIYLTANTSEKDYTITFVLNNGEASKVVTVKFGSDISQVIQDNFKNDPNKEGYTFNGWSQDSGQVLNNLVITAKWAANTYTVTFNNNGNTSTQTFTYDEAQTLTLNSENRPGYRFMGWSLSENGSVAYTDGASVINLTSNKDGNVNLYAKWEIISYTIKYELDGGINSPFNPTTYTVKDNVIFENPTKEGYTFDGWYLDGNYQTPITSTNDKYDSLTLYAKWEIINYTIKYELNGGTNNQANISQYNIELGTITLYAPTKDGYNFIGWYLNNSLVKTINIDTFNENSSITLVAKFEAKEYKVTYINELGNQEESKTIKYDEKLDLIDGEEIAGYEFAGWYLDNVKIESGVTFNYLNNITLIARYNIINYTITYELDGGTNSLSNPSTYNVENTITFANPTKTGYRFTGWTYNDSPITSTEGLTGNITVKANWEIINYDITYVLDGGTNNPSNPSTYNVEDNVTFEDPTKTGYTFTGWYTDSQFKDEVDSIEKGNIGNVTLYAKWEANTYTVTFNNNGNTSTQTFTYDEAQTLTLNSENRPGYRFMGWSTSENGSVAYADGASVINLTSNKDGNVNLYAVWEVVSYTITYELDGGTNNPSNPITYNVEDIVNFEIPTKTGYTFTGWTYNDEPITTTEGLTGNITVKANYVANTYTVTFNNNGESSTQSFTYDVAQGLTPNSITRPGYRFMGWSLSENGSVAYADGASVINLTSENDGNVNLYAVWEIVSYTITYELDSGTNNPSNPTTYNVEDNVTFTNPTKTGYTFTGWTYNDSPITSTEGLTENITVKANYVANKYQIHFDVDGLVEIDSIEVTYNQRIGDILPVLDLDTLVFNYWYYLEDDRQVTINKDTIYLYDHDITVKAELSGDYNVVYETNGGINSNNNPTRINVDELNESILLENPTRNGYTFDGWYLTSDFSSDRVYEITLALLANANNATITLYAKWNINSYNVNYVDQDGEIIKTETLNYGSYLNFFTPTKEGQIFDNWYLNGTVFDFNTPVTSDITLVAMYRLRQLSTTVTINGDIINVVVSSIDGLGIQADARIVITLIEENHVLNPVEELLAAFGIVARLYDIQLVDSNNNPIEPNGEVRVELTLPSKTLENDKTYTLYHIADNLAEYELMDSTIRNGNIEFYTTHFSYYAIVISDKVVSFLWLWILLGVLGVLLLQAIIIIIVKTRKYKITFISRGNIQVKSVKYKKDERVILPKPERLGYIFGGWYIDSKFSQPANIKTMPNQNIMLYAKWYEDPITIGLRVKKNK